MSCEIQTTPKPLTAEKKFSENVRYQLQATSGADGGQSRLEELAVAVVKVAANPEAIVQWLGRHQLEPAQSIRLVDFLNENAQRMLYGEHPVKMQQLGARAFLIADHHGYDLGRAYGLLFTGASRWFMSELSESLEQLVKAKSIFVNLEDDEGVMKTLVFEASVFRSMGDYDQSYLNLKRAIEFFRQRGDVIWESIGCMSLGMTCEQIGDFSGVKHYNQRIIEIVSEPELRWIVGRALDGIGSIHLHQGQHKKALEYYKKSLAASQDPHHPVAEARALNDIGVVYQHLGEAEKAGESYQASLDIRRLIGQREAQCTCLFNLGKISIDAGDPHGALQYFSEALSIATEVGAKPRIGQAHQHLSHAYELLGNDANALKHHKLFHRFTETVSREQSHTRTQNLKTRLELEKAERVAEVVRSRNTRLNEKNAQLELLLSDLRSAQAQLVQAEKMAALGKLVAGVAHEMNSPIGASSSSIDIAQRCIGKLEEMLTSCDTPIAAGDRKRLEKYLNCLTTNNTVVADANQRLSKIVRSLKSFSNLDEAMFQKADIHQGLDSTITLLEAELAGRVKITRQYGELPLVACYPGELNQVFLNLLTNSIEAIQDDGEILIETVIEGDQVLIKIADDGIGIPASRIKTLFDPQFSGKQARVKAGMGLFISQNIIRKHQGSIAVVSEAGSGATFTIFLPIDFEADAEDQPDVQN